MNSSIVMLSYGIIISIILWILLYYFNTKGKINFNSILLTIAGIGLLVRLSYSFLTPTFYAPDEQSHYNYAKYLSENNTLPIQTSKTNDTTNDWEYYQPPLYYMLISPIHYLLSDKENLDDSSSAIFMRLFSIILWIITLYFAYKSLLLLQIENKFLMTFAISMISLLPSYAYISSMINNDNLLTAFGSVIIYFLLKDNNLRNSIILGLLLGLAMLTKLSAVIFFIMIVIIIINRIFSKNFDRKALVNYAIMLVIGFVIWLPLGIRNLSIYGSMTAESIANLPYEWQSMTYAVYSTLLYIQKSFWAISGIHNNVSSIFPIFGMILFSISIIGLIKQFITKESKISDFVTNNKNFILIFGLTIIIHLGLIFRFGILYAQSQGRFLFPLLVPISLFLAIGLSSFKSFRKENALIHLSGFFILYSVSFAIYSIMRF